MLLGDLLYHGPRNDLPREYAPKEVIPLLNGLGDRLLCVRGNCDSEVDQMVLAFPHPGRLRRFGPGGAAGLLHPRPCVEPGEPAAPPAGDLLLHGHTHIPANEPWGQDNRYWNPGSVSLPKAGTPHSYMVLEEDRPLWKALE